MCLPPHPHFPKNISILCFSITISLFFHIFGILFASCSTCHQFRNFPKSTLPTRVGWTPHWKLGFWRLPAIVLVIFTWTDLFHKKAFEHFSTMFVWNPANPQRRSRQWWFFDLGMGATPPHTGRLIPYEGRLIRGWCHHHPKSLLKMYRNEGCLIWGWGHTWWGRAHTWWYWLVPYEVELILL